MTSLGLDYETKSEIDLTKRGLDVYSADPSTEVLMCSYSFDKEPPKLWQRDDGPFPKFLREALEDPHVIRRAFNAQFERVISRRVLKIKTPYENWRCTMVLAFMLSFNGNLAEIGAQVGLPEEKRKLAEGKKLMKMFSSPQKITKKQPHRWLDELTNPIEWDQYCGYCVQDVVSETAILDRLIKYPVRDFEWELYEIDQRINDRGLPIDIQLCQNAIKMADRRKAELTAQLIEITHLANPNSPVQLLDWLLERGYPFNDLQKETVKKVLRGVDAWDYEITSEAEAVLKLRQQVARSSVKKYNKFMDLIGADGMLRFQYQFGGAARTLRWAGRGIQPHNLPRTPKVIEADGDDVSKLAITNAAIRDDDYDLLGLIMAEPMDALAGCVRSAIRAPEGMELRVADLASIEIAVAAWLARCPRLLEVLRTGRCPYKDFATELYHIAYEAVTKAQRTYTKPALLGGIYRLGGGGLDAEGKRTGLYGYAENMGVDMPLDDAHRAVKLLRENYSEIVDCWYDLEDAISRCIMEGVTTTVGPLTFTLSKPFLTVRLPSGRFMYYYKPRIERKEYPQKDANGNFRYDEDGNLKTYTKKVFSYEGRDDKHTWCRIYSHGGKTFENFVQAIAREILAHGMMQAHKAGFRLVGSVHDELKSLQATLDKVHTLDRLIECMTTGIAWAEGMPLGAAGWCGDFYRKD